ncbi:hypothetical protein D3C76_553300 [compost metagenome]
MHRQHVFFRQQVVLHGEHGFLHFTGVAHAGDQHFLLGEVEDHAAVGVGAVTLGHALEVGDVENLPLVAADRVVLLGIDEQLTAEQVLPGGGGGHLDRQVVLLGGTYMHVGNEVVLGVVEGLDAIPQGIELVGRERTVDRAPGDIVLAARFFDDETVDRRAAGAVAGTYDQRAVVGQFAFPAADGFFDQLGNADIGVHGFVGLRHVGPRRPEAESSKHCVVTSDSHYSGKKSRDYARKAQSPCSL